MKKLILLIIIIVSYSCWNKNTGSEPFRPLNSSILAKQIFRINTNKDTSLITLHGTRIIIPANAFSDSGNIDIEIREAFSAAEIFAAGMITESNGKPLFSAGMVYINASSEKGKLSLVKPLKISMPNDFFDPNMKIFKGVETDSGTVNWVEPIEPDSTAQAKNWQNGRLFFATKCMTCHSIFKKLTGPALVNVEERGPWKERAQLYAWVNNPARYMAQNKYVQDLKDEYNGVVMTGFPDFEPSYLDAIFDYIKNESIRPGAREAEKQLSDSLSKAWAAEYSNDSSGGEYFKDAEMPCKDDTVYVNTKQQTSTFFNTSLDTSSYNNFPVQPLISPAESMEGLRKGFNNPNPTRGTYDFEIQTLGWYNVDAYVTGYAGTTNVKLWGELDAKDIFDMHVYLFCPRNKMLSVGSQIESWRYYFDKIDGGIPLFVGDRAILFAFGSAGEEMYYGISAFWIQKEQTIKIKIQKTTEEQIKQVLQTSKIDGISIGLEKKEKRILKNNCNDTLPEK